MKNLKMPDFVIQPKVGHIGTLDLKSSNATILEGEKAAQLKVDSIKKAISNFKSIPAAFKPVPRAKI